MLLKCFLILSAFSIMHMVLRNSTTFSNMCYYNKDTLNLQVFGTIVTYIVIVIQFASSEKHCENVVILNVTQCHQAFNNTIQLDL